MVIPMIMIDGDALYEEIMRQKSPTKELAKQLNNGTLEMIERRENEILGTILVFPSADDE